MVRVPGPGAAAAAAGGALGVGPFGFCSEPFCHPCELQEVQNEALEGPLVLSSY